MVSDILTDIPGEVPQVTNGSKSSALISIDLSNGAPASVVKVCQYSTAFSQFSPCGANGLPFKYSNVTSSGAIRPARAPPSMDILQTVILPSIERFLIASPAYSIT